MGSDMNDFQTRALNLLDELLKAPEGKRTIRLLPCPQSDREPVHQGLRDLSWSAGWAFDVQSSMASRLDIQYGERVIDKKKVSVYTQGTAFDFSDCTFHAREAPEVLQVVEWHPKTGDTPTTCLVSVYKEQEGKLIFRRKEEMTDIGLLKILICGAQQ